MTPPARTRYFLTFLLAAPLLLLTGCPGSNPTRVAKLPAKAVAPTLTTDAAQTARAAQADAADKARVKVEGQQLVDRAEASYHSGVANYQARRLDAARMDFDSAIDVMLSSGLDLKNDPLLSEEFERLTNAINGLEMAALKDGNGFSPKVEDAPLDTATDITFPANPELVARLKNELNVTSDLPLVINDQVAGYIDTFANSKSFRNHMAASLQRVGKYRGLIQRVLKEEGVPQDLIYLAVAESGFEPQAVNRRSGAGGMWQFMTYTGPEYGLVRNGYFDYRFDPEKSSRAYAEYIKKLYSQFGDWYLAMAAFDWGPGAVQRAVQRTGYADFWELYRRNAMPAETRAYVPQILAAVIMAKNPEKYGLDKLVPSPPVIYDTVATDYSIDLRLVADVTNTSVAELVALNPAMLRLQTPNDIPFDLHIPPGTKDVYNARLKDIPEKDRASWRFHVVIAGDTLATIASALHAKPTEIAETNGVTSVDPISVGDELVIPVETVTARSGPQRYRARRGDTLVTIADRFNVTVEDLRRWNRRSSSHVVAGHLFNVAEPLRLAPSGRMRGGRKGRAKGGRKQVSGHSAGTRAKANAATSRTTKSHDGKRKAGR
jgi:membrane-bound lytic murein transglycosylase D